MLVFFSAKIIKLAFLSCRFGGNDYLCDFKIVVMETTGTKLYSLSLRDAKTYLYSLLFVAGNIVLPRLCHFIPNGGPMFLPIFFFTLIAAYKYGVVAGLLTAVLSPLANFLLFGMPSAAVLPYVLVKSVLLAVAAAWAARRFGKVSLLVLVAVVLFYQVVGTFVQCLFVGDMVSMPSMLLVAVPGMLIQVLVGYMVIDRLG